MIKIWKTASIALFCLSGLLIACTSIEKFSASVSYFTGDVLINGEAVKAGQSLPAVFVIRTGTNSVCEIIFNDKNILHFTENCDATLDLASPLKSISLRNGGMGSVLKGLNPSKNGDAPLFKIETSTAAAAVRGTTFFVQVEDETNTYICDCNGVLDMSDEAGKNTMKIESAHHKAFRFGKSEKGSYYENAGLLYHDDPGVNDLAKKIGVTIDWTKPDKKPY